MISNSIAMDKEFLKYLRIFVTLGFLFHLSLNFNTYRLQASHMIILIINYTLIIFYFFMKIDLSFLMTRIFRYFIFTLLVVNECFAILALQQMNLNLLQSSMLTISLTLIVQALSANLDPMILYKYKVMLLDVSLLLISLCTIFHILKYDIYLAIYLTLILTIVTSIAYIINNLELKYFAFLIIIFLPSFNEILLFKVLAIVTIYSYIQGYTSALICGSANLVPSYDSKTLISVVISTTLASVVSSLLREVGMVYLLYLVSISIPVFKSLITCRLKILCS